MAERAEALVLQMSADIRRMEKALEKISGDTNRHLGATEQRFDKLNAHVKRSGDQLAADFRRSIAAIGIYQAVQGLGRYADTWTNLRNQVKQYADVVGPVGAATDRLTDIANNAGVQVDALGQTFAASARAARTLGASAEQVYLFNEAVAQGAAVANTGPAALEGALRQLGQAIGSPRVQLEEFNSVIEGTPRLAQAFADGIGEANGSISKLRELIASGQISGGELFQGLISQVGRLQSEFDSMEKTVSQSLNRLGNATLRYVGETNQATGAGQALAAVIDLVANNFDLLADAALVATAVMGGAAALGAVSRLIQGLSLVAKQASDAKTKMEALSKVGAFLRSGAGVAILGIGAALATVAFEAFQAKDPIDDVRTAMDNLSKTQGAIESDTQKLTLAQNALTKAMKEQSQAAQTAARVDIEAIRARISANRDLALSYELDIRNKLDQARRGLADTEAQYASTIKGIRGLPDFITRPQGGDSFIPALVLNEVARRQDDAKPVPLDSSMQFALEITNELLGKRREIAELSQDVADILQLRRQIASGGGGGPVSAGGSAGVSNIRGYTLAIEELQTTLRGLTAARLAEGEAIAAIQARIDGLAPNVDEEAGGRERLLQLENELAAATEARMIADQERSRAAVQAALTFADATGSVRAALDQIPNFQELLFGGDEGILRGELAKRLQAIVDAVATGRRELEIKRDDEFATIDRAMMEALGFDKATFDAMSASAKRQLNGAADDFLEAFGEAWQRYTDGVASLTQETSTLDLTAGPDLQSSADLITGDADTLAAGILSPDANQAFREQMRDSVKQAMRDGIRTGDWDEAFRSVLADAVTSGLDAALNRVGDWLADFLFAPDGFLGGVINGAGAWAGSMIFGGARAAGGPVSPGKTYLVGERGPELLTMGGAGNVINASDTNRMLSGMGGAGAIDARVIFSGPIDATNLNEVRRMLDHQRQQIMSSVPTMVRATHTYDRKHRR